MRLHHYLNFGKIKGIVGILWHMYGIKAPAVIVSRLCTYGWCRLFRSGKTFLFDGCRYSYVYNLQNATFRNERAVEIPIALTKFPLQGDVLEVGNVLSQYMKFPHDVVDKYEQDVQVQNVDIVEYCPNKQYDLVISISTFEHVGWDEIPKEPAKVVRAVQQVKSLLKPAGRLLVTVPTGYNEFLDACLRTNSLGFSRVLYMKRTSRANDWEEATCEEALARKYGSIYPCANAIAVCMFKNHA